MKVNELQIGDYVNYRSQIIKITSLYDKGGSNEVGWSDKESVWVNADNVEPVPLTPEILEKNGFTKYIPGYSFQNFKLYGNLRDDDTVYFTMNINGEYITIDYINQLQQAMRICGIKKEIEL